MKAVITPLFPKIEFVDVDLNIIVDFNGLIDQGEVIETRVILNNNENWGEAINVFGSLGLVEENSNINITQATTNFGNADPGGVLFNESDPFIITFGSDAPIGLIEFKLDIISNIDDYVQNEQELLFSLEVFEVSAFLGDLNQDSIINILDIIIVVNIILGNTPTSYQLEAGDVNMDSIINVLDIINIVNIILDN